MRPTFALSVHLLTPVIKRFKQDLFLRTEFIPQTAVVGSDTRLFSRPRPSNSPQDVAQLVLGENSIFTNWEDNRKGDFLGLSGKINE